jgi:hypothetical protein
LQNYLSLTGLKIHKKKKHGSKSCEACDDVFDSRRDLKIHMYTHSYTDVGSFLKPKQSCKICDFECKTEDSMIVHLGKCHSENLECGLCEAGFDELNKLEMHLNTCEVYECGSCNIRNTSISEIKKHIQKEHDESTKIWYLKLDRNNSSEVSSKSYKLSDL